MARYASAVLQSSLHDPIVIHQHINVSPYTWDLRIYMYVSSIEYRTRHLAANSDVLTRVNLIMILTNAVVGVPARQVPTICHDISQALDGIGHAHGKCKATEKIQHQREIERRAQVSKQGVSSTQAIWTNRAQV